MGKMGKPFDVLRLLRVKWVKVKKYFTFKKASKSGPKWGQNDKSERVLTKKLQKVNDFVQFCTPFLNSIY